MEQIYKKLIIITVIILIVIILTSNSEEQSEQMMKIALVTGFIWFGGIYILFSYLFRDKK